MPIAYIVVLPMQYTPLSKGSPRITQHSIIHSACVLDAMLLLYFITPYKPSKTNFHFWKTMAVYHVDRRKKTRRTLLVWEEASMAPGPRSRTNRLANCRLPLLSFVSHSELGLFFLLQCCLVYNKKLWSFWFNCTIIIIGTTFLPISPVCKSEILWLAPLVFAQLLRPKGPTWRRRFDNNCWKQTARDRTVERHM